MPRLYSLQPVTEPMRMRSLYARSSSGYDEYGAGTPAIGFTSFLVYRS